MKCATPTLLWQGIKQLGGGVEAFLAVARNLLPCAPERLLAGDAFEPAVVGEPFVVGEVQPHEEADALAPIGPGCLSRSFFFGPLAAVGFRRGLSLKLELHLLAQMECLFPALDAVSRLLRGLLVRPEIEN